MSEMRRTSWGSCSVIAGDDRMLLNTMSMSCFLSGSRGRSSTMISATCSRVRAPKASSWVRHELKNEREGKKVERKKHWDVLIYCTHSIKLRIQQVHLLHSGKLRESTQVHHDPLVTAVTHAGTCRGPHRVTSDWSSPLFEMFSIIQSSKSLNLGYVSRGFRSVMPLNGSGFLLESYPI